MSQQPAKSLDILVHPFYRISQVVSSILIDDESARNVEALGRLWVNSIDAVASDERRFLAVVNGTHLTEEQLKPHPYSNPYRGRYRDIVAHAQRSLGSRLFYFSPSVKSTGLAVENADGALNLARQDNTIMPYDKETLLIIAYGEHVDIQNGAGCVDVSARDVAEILGVPKANITIDGVRSLPLQPVVKLFTPIPGFYVPTTLYLTVPQLAQLSP